MLWTRLAVATLMTVVVLVVAQFNNTMLPTVAIGAAAAGTIPPSCTGTTFGTPQTISIDPSVAGPYTVLLTGCAYPNGLTITSTSSATPITGVTLRTGGTVSVSDFTIAASVKVGAGSVFDFGGMVISGDVYLNADVTSGGELVMGSSSSSSGSAATTTIAGTLDVTTQVSACGALRFEHLNIVTSAWAALNLNNLRVDAGGLFSMVNATFVASTSSGYGVIWASGAKVLSGGTFLVDTVTFKGKYAHDAAVIAAGGSMIVRRSVFDGVTRCFTASLAGGRIDVDTTNRFIGGGDVSIVHTASSSSTPLSGSAVPFPPSDFVLSAASSIGYFTWSRPSPYAANGDVIGFEDGAVVSQTVTVRAGTPATNVTIAVGAITIGANFDLIASTFAAPSTIRFNGTVADTFQWDYTATGTALELHGISATTTAVLSIVQTDAPIIFNHSAIQYMEVYGKYYGDNATVLLHHSVFNTGSSNSYSVIFAPQVWSVGGGSIALDIFQSHFSCNGLLSFSIQTNVPSGATIRVAESSFKNLRTTASGSTPGAFAAFSTTYLTAGNVQRSLQSGSQLLVRASHFECSNINCAPAFLYSTGGVFYWDRTNSGKGPGRFNVESNNHLQHHRLAFCGLTNNAGLQIYQPSSKLFQNMTVLVCDSPQAGPLNLDMGAVSLSSVIKVSNVTSSTSGIAILAASTTDLSLSIDRFLSVPASAIGVIDLSIATMDAGTIVTVTNGSFFRLGASGTIKSGATVAVSQNVIVDRIEWTGTVQGGALVRIANNSVLGGVSPSGIGANRLYLNTITFQATSTLEVVGNHFGSTSGTTGSNHVGAYFITTLFFGTVYWFGNTHDGGSSGDGFKMGTGSEFRAGSTVWFRNGNIFKAGSVSKFSLQLIMNGGIVYHDESNVYSTAGKCEVTINGGTGTISHYFALASPPPAGRFVWQRNGGSTTGGDKVSVAGTSVGGSNSLQSLYIDMGTSCSNCVFMMADMTVTTDATINIQDSSSIGGNTVLIMACTTKKITLTGQFSATSVALFNQSTMTAIDATANFNGGLLDINAVTIHITSGNNIRVAGSVKSGSRVQIRNSDLRNNGGTAVSLSSASYFSTGSFAMIGTTTFKGGLTTASSMPSQSFEVWGCEFSQSTLWISFASSASDVLIVGNKAQTFALSGSSSSGGRFAGCNIQGTGSTPNYPITTFGFTDVGCSAATTVLRCVATGTSVATDVTTSGSAIPSCVTLPASTAAVVALTVYAGVVPSDGGSISNPAASAIDGVLPLVWWQPLVDFLLTSLLPYAQWTAPAGAAASASTGPAAGSGWEVGVGACLPSPGAAPALPPPTASPSHSPSAGTITTTTTISHLSGTESDISATPSSTSSSSFSHSYSSSKSVSASPSVVTTTVTPTKGSTTSSTLMTPTTSQSPSPSQPSASPSPLSASLSPPVTPTTISTSESLSPSPSPSSSSPKSNSKTVRHSLTSSADDVTKTMSSSSAMEETTSSHSPASWRRVSKSLSAAAPTASASPFQGPANNTLTNNATTTAAATTTTTANTTVTTTTSPVATTTPTVPTDNTTTGTTAFPSTTAAAAALTTSTSAAASASTSVAAATTTTTTAGTTTTTTTTTTDPCNPFAFSTSSTAAAASSSSSITADGMVPLANVTSLALPRPLISISDADIIRTNSGSTTDSRSITGSGDDAANRAGGGGGVWFEIENIKPFVEASTMPSWSSFETRWRSRLGFPLSLYSSASASSEEDNVTQFVINHSHQPNTSTSPAPNATTTSSSSSSGSGSSGVLLFAAASPSEAEEPFGLSSLLRRGGLQCVVPNASSTVIHCRLQSQGIFYISEAEAVVDLYVASTRLDFVSVDDETRTTTAMTVAAATSTTTAATAAGPTTTNPPATTNPSPATTSGPLSPCHPPWSTSATSAASPPSSSSPSPSSSTPLTPTTQNSNHNEHNALVYYHLATLRVVRSRPPPATAATTDGVMTAAAATAAAGALLLLEGTSIEVQIMLAILAPPRSTIASAIASTARAAAGGIGNSDSVGRGSSVSVGGGCATAADRKSTRAVRFFLSPFSVMTNINDSHNYDKDDNAEEAYWWTTGNVGLSLAAVLLHALIFFFLVLLSSSSSSLSSSSLAVCRRRRRWVHFPSVSLSLAALWYMGAALGTVRIVSDLVALGGGAGKGRGGGNRRAMLAAAVIGSVYLAAVPVVVWALVRRLTVKPTQTQYNSTNTNAHANGDPRHDQHSVWQFISLPSPAKNQGEREETNNGSTSDNNNKKDPPHKTSSSSHRNIHQRYQYHPSDLEDLGLDDDDDDEQCEHNNNKKKKKRSRHNTPTTTSGSGPRIITTTTRLATSSSSASYDSPSDLQAASPSFITRALSSCFLCAKHPSKSGSAGRDGSSKGESEEKRCVNILSRWPLRPSGVWDWSSKHGELNLTATVAVTAAAVVNNVDHYRHSEDEDEVHKGDHHYDDNDEGVELSDCTCSGKDKDNKVQKRRTTPALTTKFTKRNTHPPRRNTFHKNDRNHYPEQQRQQQWPWWWDASIVGIVGPYRGSSGDDSDVSAAHNHHTHTRSSPLRLPAAQCQYFALLPFLLCPIVAVVLFAGDGDNHHHQPSSSSSQLLPLHQCFPRLLVIACLCVTVAIVIAVARPFRTPLTNGLTVVAFGCVAAIATLQAQLFYAPSLVVEQWKWVFIVALVATVIMRSLFALLLALAARLRWTPTTIPSDHRRPALFDDNGTTIMMDDINIDNENSTVRDKNNNNSDSNRRLALLMVPADTARSPASNTAAATDVEMNNNDASFLSASTSSSSSFFSSSSLVVSVTDMTTAHATEKTRNVTNVGNFPTIAATAPAGHTHKAYPFEEVSDDMRENNDTLDAVEDDLQDVYFSSSSFSSTEQLVLVLDRPIRTEQKRIGGKREDGDKSAAAVEADRQVDDDDASSSFSSAASCVVRLPAIDVDALYQMNHHRQEGRRSAGDTEDDFDDFL